MLDTIETKTVGKYTVTLYYDNHFSNIYNPREWDNLGTFWTFHRDYYSPDKTPDKDPWVALAEEFDVYNRDGDLEDNPERIMRHIKKLAIIQPVYMYDHSGVSYSTSPFSCPWDSGQIGWTFVRKSDVRKEYNVKRISPKIHDQIAKILTSEVDIYSAWASGQIYGWSVENNQGDVIESCGGYVDTDYGEYAMSEAIATAHYLIAEDRKKRTDTIKTMIRKNIPLNLRHTILTDKNLLTV